MTILVVTGTSTGVGKTVVTAAIAVNALGRGQSVAVVKPAQTGVGPHDPGDLQEVARLTGITDLHEYQRLPDPLAPAAAARLSGRPPLDVADCAGRIEVLAQSRDLVLVEGAGGLLVHLDHDGATVADLAQQLGAPVLVVAHPTLGTLNHTALTLEAMERRSLASAGVVLGWWPADADLACRCNLIDLAVIGGGPIAGVLPADAAQLSPSEFADAAAAGLGPELGGRFDAADFTLRHGPAASPEETE